MRVRRTGISITKVSKKEYKKRFTLSEMFQKKCIGMKDIVRQCHIKSPQYHVQCILGKKYPES